jgi:AcrR family transcriptional regulator
VVRDAESTKQRILEAATREFAARGAAGARIDRIAAAASANKERIYAYFGSKEQLFECAVEEQVARFHHEVSFDPRRLPDFAAEAHYFFVAQPELARLGAWHALEEGQQEHPIEAIADEWRSRVRAVARAQRNGSVSTEIGASELLVLVYAIARAWVVATPEARAAGRAGKSGQRKVVYEAVRRLAGP